MMRPPAFNVGMTLAELEKQAILFTVQYFQGNATAAAKSLGLSDKTVRTKLEQFEREQQDERERATDKRHADRELLKRMRGNPLGVNPTPFNGHRNGEQIQPANLERRMEEVAKATAANGAGIYRTEAGLPMESASKTSAQQSVSVPKRQEIQSVPPKHASGNRNR